MSRPGPRPLAFHLVMQATSLLSSQVGLTLWRSGSESWNHFFARLEPSLRDQLAQADPIALHRALNDETLSRVESFLKGVEAYRNHPYRRTLSPAPEIWRSGSTRLLDYSLPGAQGPAVLVVPSLVNRAYILDLTERRSLMRSLARRGLRPYLVDWDSPGEAEKSFGLEAYVTGRLNDALDEVRARAGTPVLVGYCMGGLLGLALANLREQDLAGLILLATPWDFRAPKPRGSDNMRQFLALLTEHLHPLPVDMLQMLFSLQDPAAVERKYRQFPSMRRHSAQARNFVALEDWANDCVPLTARVAEETLIGWYHDNQPARGTWRIGGAAVRPENLRLPTLLMVPARDRIVPPEQALPLKERMAQAECLIVDGGHVGMMLGPKAGGEIYGVIAKSAKRMARVRKRSVKTL